MFGMPFAMHRHETTHAFEGTPTPNPKHNLLALEYTPPLEIQLLLVFCLICRVEVSCRVTVAFRSGLAIQDDAGPQHPRVRSLLGSVIPPTTLVRARDPKY